MSRPWKVAALLAVIAAAACSSPMQPEPAVVKAPSAVPAADMDTTAGPLCSGWSVANGTTCP